MDEKTEKEQNVFMNNRNVQGDFDSDMLKNLLDGIDYNLAGLDDLTKEGIECKNIDRSIDFYEDSKENQITRHNEIQKIKDRIGSQNGFDKDNGMLSYVVLSFKTPTERANFMEAFGYGFDEKYIDGNDFMNRIEFGIE